MSERRPDKKLAPNITRPGESLERKGSNRVTELLPDILQTTVNKQFFDSTFEQLMSSGSLEPIKHFIGKPFGRQFAPSAEDNYFCLLYTSPSPRDLSTSRMPSSA